MALLNVNPTRMELTNLKRKLITARRGHKLLKDKRDELMRRFLELVRENRALRQRMESRLAKANQHMAVARSVMQSEALEVALLHPKQRIQLEIEEQNVMSVRVPVFKIKTKTADKHDIYSYGFAFTSGDLDSTVKMLSDVTLELLRLAEVEKACQLIAAEIEKTRRRVNALEHVVIPQYQETIRFISMKLEETERSATTRLMKIKDRMIRQTR